MAPITRSLLPPRSTDVVVRSLDSIAKRDIHVSLKAAIIFLIVIILMGIGLLIRYCCGRPATNNAEDVEIPLQNLTPAAEEARLVARNNLNTTRAQHAGLIMPLAGSNAVDWAYAHAARVVRTTGSVSDGSAQQNVDAANDANDDDQTVVGNSRDNSETNTLASDERTLVEEEVDTTAASEHTTSLRSSADDADDEDSTDLADNNHTGVYHADDDGESLTSEDYEAMTRSVVNDREYLAARRGWRSLEEWEFEE